MSKRQATTFVIEETAQEKTKASRKPYTYTPENNALFEKLPESISGVGEQDDSLSYLRLEKLPIKGLKTLFYSAVAILLFFAGWQLISLGYQAWQLHSLVFVIYMVLLSAALLSAGYVTWQYLTERQTISELQRLQIQADKIAANIASGEAKYYIQALQDFYRDKPQYALLKSCVDKLPDYSNDKEALQHIEQHFFVRLDKEAQRRISTISLQTAIGVGVSPWLGVDVLIAFWRNIVLLNEVAQVYGIRPSISNRLYLFKQVLGNLLFVGTTEAAIDQAFEEMGLENLTAILSARVFQGFGAGVYTIRVGLSAMSVCRPMGFVKQTKPVFTAIVMQLVDQIRRKK